LLLLTGEFRSQLLDDGFGLALDRKMSVSLRSKYRPKMRIIGCSDELQVCQCGIAALLHTSFRDN
jgi:hypothetical protein